MVRSQQQRRQTRWSAGIRYNKSRAGGQARWRETYQTVAVTEVKSSNKSRGRPQEVNLADCWIILHAGAGDTKKVEI